MKNAANEALAKLVKWAVEQSSKTHNRIAMDARLTWMQLRDHLDGTHAPSIKTLYRILSACDCGLVLEASNGNVRHRIMIRGRDDT
jgi:DNA-binding phage protein